MTPLNDEDPAIPCGLAARSFFNDEYKIEKIEESGSNTKIEIDDETNIAWESDKEYRFKNTKKEEIDKMNDSSIKDWQDI